MEKNLSSGRRSPSVQPFRSLLGQALPHGKAVQGRDRWHDAYLHVQPTFLQVGKHDGDLAANFLQSHLQAQQVQMGGCQEFRLFQPRWRRFGHVLTYWSHPRNTWDLENAGLRLGQGLEAIEWRRIPAKHVIHNVFLEVFSQPLTTVKCFEDLKRLVEDAVSYRIRLHRPLNRNVQPK